MPEHEIPAGLATEIALGDEGVVVFPANGLRTAGLLVDVVEEDLSPGESDAPSRMGVASDLVTVVAEDSAGLPVTTLPHELLRQAKGPQGAPAATGFVPGVELSIAVDQDAVRGVDPNRVKMFHRATDGEEWSTLPSAYDPNTGLVTGHSDSLSQFAVFAADQVTALAIGPGPTVVLDPDNDVGFATWGAELTELEQNLNLTTALSGELQRECQAEVVLTRGQDPQVSPTIRAQIAENADPDLMVTLAFNALDEAGREPGSAWGTETDGGVRAWATSPGDVAFADRFLQSVPEFTGRPSTIPVQPSNGLVPYGALDALDVTYAHVEMLFLDHSFDQPVIAERFDLVVDAAFAAIAAQLEADGFSCDGTVLPERPPVEELRALRNLGWQNHQLYGADPVSFSSGNYVMDEPVFVVSGVGDQLIDFNLVYNSQDTRESIFGIGWSFAYNAAYREYDDGGVLIRLGDGRSLVFEAGPGGSFVAAPGSNSTLRRLVDGVVELSSNNVEKHRFDVDPVSGVGVLIATEDRQGNSMAFDWGNPTGPRQLQPLLKVTDEAGQVVTLSPNADGRIASITHPDGRVWSFNYGNDRLAGLTDARGTTRSFGYSADGYMETVTAGDGVAYVANTYDDQGRVTSQRNATGDVRSFDYQEGRTVYTDALGNETSYVFDDQGKVTETVNALGDSATIGYDTNFNPVTETDEEGRVARTEFDVMGRPTKITDPIGSVQTMTYNSFGDLIEMDQPDGLGGRRTTRFEVNSQGRVTKTTFDDGSTQLATFDDLGDRISVTDQNGNTTRFELDDRGNTTKIVDALGGTSTATYDLANRQVSLTDENGHTTTYLFDAADNLVSLTDPLGNKTAHEYDVNNKRTSTTDALGRTTSYRYDRNLNLVGVAHPDGAEESFTLDAEYGVVTRTDGRGNELKTVFDALLRPAETIDQAGEKWTTDYDAVGNPIKITDPNGETVSLVYDPLDRVVERTDQNGQTWKTTFDTAGNRVADTAPDGTTITAEFDSLGRMKAAVDEQGNRTNVTYDVVGNVTSRSDRRGNTSTMSYDALNRVVETTAPDGGVSRQGYDPAGNLVTVTDPLGGVVQTTYDAANRAIVNTDQLGVVSTTDYDAVGNPILTRDGEGNEWRMTYDAMNRLAARISPIGDADRYRYDANGNLVTLTKADGVVAKRFYDRRNDLVQIVENARDGEPLSADVNVTTGYERDAVGRIVAMVDANGHRTRYERDARGDITKRIDPLDRTTSWTYTPVGTVASKTDGNGNETSYSYASDRQPEALLYADGSTINYVYDADNFQVSMTDSLGITSWTRDWRGRETSSTDVNANTVEHRYDLNGNMVELGYADGFDSVRTYDAANRLASVTDPSGTVRYQRDKLGRVREVTHPNGVTTEVFFDAEGNITTIDRQGPKTKPTETALRLEYTYTPDDLIATRTMATGKGNKEGKPGDLGKNGYEKTSFSYDGLDRLVASEVGGGPAAWFEYDAVGNRLSHEANDDPEKASPKDLLSVSYYYDDADQLITETQRTKNKSEVITRHYDNNGNQTASSAQRRNAKGKPVGKPEAESYAYNLRDELIAAGETTLVRDGLGRAMTERDRKNSTVYIYDQSHVVETRGADSAIFVRDESQQLLSQTVGKKPKTEVLLTDLIGSVLGSVDEKGKSSKIADFADFGQYVGKQKPVSIFGFAGELHDIDDQRIDFLARSYDPTVGRFLQRDRAGQDVEKPATFHPYIYAFAAPTTYTDYLGNFGWSSVTNFVKEHKATIASVAVGVAVGVAVAACIGTVVCGGIALGALATASVVGATSAVAAGATYRALDNDDSTRAFDLTSIGFDFTIGAIAGPVVSRGGSLISTGVRNATTRAAATTTGQRVASSTVGRAVTSTVSTARSTVTRTTQRVAQATRQRAADTTSSFKRTLATSRDRAATGATNLRNRVTSPQSGRAATPNYANYGGEFLDDFAGLSTRAPAIADDILPKPAVSDTRLGNIVDDLYKGTTNQNRVGSGTTADAVRYETLTGQPVGGRFHTAKAEQYSNALNRVLKNDSLNDPDRLVARSLLDDLQNALGNGP